MNYELFKVVDLKDPKLDPAIYVQCLQLRRDVFIRNLGWNLYEHMGCEFDEYDTPAAVHVVLLDGSKVLGCMRLLRTDNCQGSTSYMILDAHRGHIPNLPAGLLNEEIAEPTTWEASRIAISHEVPQTDRNRALLGLVRAGVDYVSNRGGTSMLGMMNPVFARVFKRGGLQAYAIGPTLDQRDGRICVLRLDFPAARIPVVASLEVA